ncbi:MAG TPA: hypothetical protein VG826_33090 [Pirellulales bacterium]|nr:hypothetical protein [Pirellulales bacterium]
MARQHRSFAAGLTRPVIEIAVSIESVLKEAIDQQPIVDIGLIPVEGDRRT